MIRFEQGRLNKIFNTFKNKKIIVIGDLMVDEYLMGKVNRLSPEAPVPIVEIAEESYHFGGAANVSYNLKHLGCVPITLGVIGNDRAGDILLELFRKQAMPSEGIIVADGQPTTLKTRIIGEHQHIARVDRERIHYDNAHIIRQLKERFDAFIGQADAVILEDYNKGVLTRELIRHVVNKANQYSIPVTVDPKFVNFLEYKNVTVFKPNLKETVHALGHPVESDADVEQAGHELLEKLNAQAILITRGSAGMSLIEKDGDSNHIPTRTRHVADVSGAGDTVISTLTAAMCGGANLKEAATIANFAAGLVCEEVGIVPIKKDALLETIKENYLIHA